MSKKIAKKISSLFISFAIVLGMVTPVSVQALESPFVFDEEKTYSIISSRGKAIDVKNVGWGSNDTSATGEYRSKSQSVNPTSIFKFGSTTYSPSLEADETIVRMYYYDTEGKYHPIRSEGNDFIFADPNNRGGVDDTNDDNIKLATYIIKRTGTNTGVIKESSRNYYLTVNDKGEIRKSANIEEAETFTFVENPQIIDDTLYIENVSTKKIVTFKDQVHLAPIKVVETTEITDTEKFMPVFGTNSNYEIPGMSGPINVVTLKSKADPSMCMISANWNNGADSAIVGAKKNPGGWESIVIQPAGDGTVVLRSSYTYQYVTINGNDELELCDLTKDELTNKEKFIIHTTAEVTPSNDLTFTERSQTTVDLAWTNPVHIYTDVELYQKDLNDVEYHKVTTLTDESSYQVKDLTPGMQYQFKLRFINGNGDLENPANPMDESNELTVKTRAGAKPETPTNVKLVNDEKNHKFIVSYDAALNATHYQILCAESLFGQYEVVKTVNKDQLSVELDYTDNNKYNCYYRVVALNNGDDVDLTDPEFSEESDYVSLERNMFGNHTLIFAETDDVAKVNETLKNIFDQANDGKNDAQFKGAHYQIYFKPGDYTQTDCMYLGFYTSFNGLGRTPHDVRLNNVAVPAYLSDNNATCNFWRSMENVSIIATGNPQGKPEGTWHGEDFVWGVAQAAPLRRVYSERPVAYDWNYGWASGGYVSDCYFEGNAGTASGQQFFTRNSVVKGDAFGTTLNNFFLGVESDSLPNADTGKQLLNGNGYSNWDMGEIGASQQVTTSITETPRIKEKPFMFIDNDGEYKIFVPALRENVKGVSWGEGKANDGMGEGTIMSLDEFYIAKEGDTAQTINEKLAAGMNIYFTPGVYHAEEVIQINEANTIVLGSGMATIIPDNSEGAIKIADVDGVTVSGIILDAGAHSKYLLTVGEEGTHKDHSENPTLLQDIFFRVGGTSDTLTKADDALIINSDDVIGDHFWIWRADHGAGVEWYGNESQHGLIVNGDDVTCYALFNEHFQEYNTLWNGNNGSTYFYQNETAYDPISQEAWMSHNGTVNGYSSYKVSNKVTSHYAVGLGIYNVFINTGEDYDSSKVQIQLDNAIEVPNNVNVVVENACLQTFAQENASMQKINSIINGVGNGVSSGIDLETGEKGDGWSRQYLISYQNGTAVVGKKPDDSQKGQYIGTDTITNIKPLGDDDLDIKGLNKLIEEAQAKNEADYTKESWTYFQNTLNAAINMAESRDFLKYGTNESCEGMKEQLADALDSLVLKGDKAILETLVKDCESYDKDKYTTESWDALQKALADAKKVLKAEDATQEQVDEAVEALSMAIDNLVEKANKDKLSSIVDKAEDVELKDYTEESVKEFKDALENAKDVLANENATQEEVDQALKELENAKEGLVLKEVTVTPKPGEDDKENNETDHVDTSDHTSIQLLSLACMISMLGYTFLKRKKC